MPEPEQLEDTEIMLALLSSLLQPPIPSQEALLNALISCEGDVQAAAKSLDRPAPTTSAGKRPAQGCLDNWLNGPWHDCEARKKRKPDIYSQGSASTSTSGGGPSNGTQAQAQVAENQPIRSSVLKLSAVLQNPTSPSSSDPLTAFPSNRLHPLTLSNPESVEKHTPCTMHLRVLPPDMACRLFYTMIHASRSWRRSQWLINDRVVESPHKSCFYARASNGIDDNTEWQKLSQYWYNGETAGTPPLFHLEMEKACQIIEDVVNAELKKRQRHPLEWGGAALDGHSWKANVAVSNCYTGSKEGVGFHSDQLTYLGPVPTIASLSLGTTRIFRLREVIPRSEREDRQAQTFSIPVVHNSLVIMHASTQERFKHTIPSQKAIDMFHPPFSPHVDMDTSDVGRCRINITFRFYRPDFRPETTPKCNCNIPCILRADLKGRVEGQEQRYFWMCYAGLQASDSKGCSFVKVMDLAAEGRGPFIGKQQVQTHVLNSNSNGECNNMF